MDKLQAITDAVELFFRTEKDIGGAVVQLERPHPERGDVAVSSALKYAKQLHMNALDLAEELAAYLLEKDIDVIDTVETARPGFVNIRLSSSFFNAIVADVLEKREDWGKSALRAGEKWVIEHTSPNPNKAMHLGHLRNNLIGMSLAYLIEWEGAEVVRDAVDNNRGIAIAKVMWGYLSHMKKEGETTDIRYWSLHRDEWFTPEEKGLTPDRFITECYILGEADSKNAEKEAEIRKLVLTWEAGNVDTRALWEYVLGYSYQGMQRTLARLGNTWDVVWHEHDYYEEGKRWVQKGLQRGVFKTLEDGAVLSDLSQYGIPDTILLKNDGTSLYITQDIALTAMKKDAYKADKLVWVIGPEQSLATKQLFAIAEQLGIGNREDFIHVSYGYVGLADENGFKRMSSREGTVVLIDDVIDAVKRKVTQRMEREDEDSAEKLAVGAVKFAILKAHKDQQLAFDVEKSVDVRGDSGVYLLYTYARIRSILRKAAEKGIQPLLGEGMDSGLAVSRLLPVFLTAVVRSDQDLSTHHVAQYLLELSSLFNKWYNEEHILDGGEAETHKVAVAEAVSIVLKNGLSLLGIETLEEI